MQKLIVDFKNKTISLEGSWKFSELIKQVKSIDDYETFTINTYSEKDKTKDALSKSISTPLQYGTKQPGTTFPWTSDKVTCTNLSSPLNGNITFTTNGDEKVFTNGGIGSTTSAFNKNIKNNI